MSLQAPVAGGSASRGRGFRWHRIASARVWLRLLEAYTALGVLDPQRAAELRDLAAAGQPTHPDWLLPSIDQRRDALNAASYPRINEARDTAVYLLAYAAILTWVWPLNPINPTATRALTTLEQSSFRWALSAPTLIGGGDPHPATQLVITLVTSPATNAAALEVLDALPAGRDGAAMIQAAVDASARISTRALGQVV
jgi:hypothetical protein